MTNSPVKYDEFGIPIKPRQEVDEFGIEIKKVGGEQEVAGSSTSSGPPAEPSGQFGELQKAANILAAKAARGDKTAEASLEYIRRKMQPPKPQETVDIESVDIENPSESTSVQPEVDPTQQVERTERVPEMIALNYRTYAGQRAKSVEATGDITRDEARDVAKLTALDYLDYRAEVKPDIGVYERDKYIKIKETPLEERDETDESFLRKIESEAIEARFLAEQQELRDIQVAIEDAPDEQTKRSLYGEYARKKETMESLRATHEMVPGEYQKVADLEEETKKRKEERFENLKQPASTWTGFKARTGEFVDQMAGAIGSGTVSMGQVPKVIGDLLGDQSYGWTDELFDSIDNMKSEREGEFGRPEKEGESFSNLPLSSKLSLIGGSAIGSAMLYGAGGKFGGSTKLGQRAATFGTAFLTSEGDYYSEALAAGMSPQEAAVAGTFLATVTGAVESIIPDVKYFEPSAFRASLRNSVTDAVKSGLPVKEALKQGTKEAINALPESAKAYLKTAGKEGLEEAAGQLGEDLGKELINSIGEKEYFTDTFNPEAYQEAVLGGFIAGGGLNVFSRPGRKSPTSEETLLEIAENDEKVLASLDPNNETDKNIIVQAAENLDALKTHTEWNNLSREDQAHALALSQEVKQIEEEQKTVGKVGLTDVAKEERIAELQGEINDIFNQPKEEKEKASVEASSPKSLNQNPTTDIEETNVEEKTEPANEGVTDGDIQPEPVAEQVSTEPLGTGTMGEEGRVGTGVVSEEKVPAQKDSKLIERAKAAREKARQLREVTGGTAMVAPKLVAGALDAYASVLETVDGTIEMARAAARKYIQDNATPEELDDTMSAIETEITDEPPVVEAPIAEPPKGERKERKFITSIKESADISDQTKSAFKEDRIVYEQLPNLVSTKEAKAIIDAMGTEEAHKLALNPNSKIRGAFRTSVAQQLIKKYNEEGNYTAAADVAEGIAEIATDYGQGIQALSMFQFLTPEGQLLFAQREIGRQRSEKIEKHKKKLGKIKKAIDKTRKEAAAEVAETLGETKVSIPKPPKRDRSYGAKNRIVTKDRYEKARQALSGKLLSGVPPELIEVAAFHIEAGARDFAEFTKRMVEDFGEKVNKYLKEVYDAAVDDLDAKVKEEDINDLSKEFGKLLSQRVPSDKARKTKEEKLKELAAKLDELTGTTDYTSMFSEAEKLSEEAKREKLQKAWNKARAKHEERKKTAEEKERERREQEENDRKLAEANKDLKEGEKAEKKAISEGNIREGLKDLDTTIKDIVKQHFSEIEQTGKTLSEKLAAEAGLTGPEADALAAKIEKEFKRLVDEKRRKEINRLFNPIERKRYNIKQLEDKIIEQSNLGAFDEAALNEAYADALGFPKLTEENAKKIKELADKIQKTPEDSIFRFRAVEDLLKYQATIKGTSLGEVALAIYMANILSGPKTQAVNILANQLKSYSEFEIAVIQNPRALGFLAKAWLVGARRGYLGFSDTLRSGYAPVKGKVEIPDVLERHWAGAVHKYVKRFMMAADAFNYEANREFRMAQMAWKMAREEKKDTPTVDVRQRALEILNRDSQDLIDASDAAKAERDENIREINNSNATPAEKKKLIDQANRDFKRRIHEFIEAGRDEKQVAEAKDFGVKSTFNNPPEGLLGHLARGMNSVLREIPALRLVVPFVNVIANVANSSLNYTPVGAARSIKGRPLAAGARHNQDYTDQERIDMLIKSAIGMARMIALFMLTAGDDEEEPVMEVTANGYGDYKKNQQLMEDGWRPFSFRVKKPDGSYTPWISYQNNPAFAAYSFMGNFRDAEKYKKEKIDDEFWTKVGISSMATMKQIAVDQTFLQSLGNNLNDVTSGRYDKYDEGIRDFAVKRGSALVVPNFLIQNAQLAEDFMDLPQKEIRDTYMGRIAQHLPPTRDLYPNKINSLGEEIGTDFEFIVAINEPNEVTKLYELANDKKYNIGVPNQSSLTLIDDSGKEKIVTPDEYEKFLKIRGSFIRNMMEDQYDRIKKFDDKEFAKWMDSVKGFATTVGKVFLDKEIPEETENYWEYIKSQYPAEYIKTFMVIPNESASSPWGVEGEVIEKTIMQSIEP